MEKGRLYVRLVGEMKEIGDCERVLAPSDSYMERCNGKGVIWAKNWCRDLNWATECLSFCCVIDKTILTI